MVVVTGNLEVAVHWEDARTYYLSVHLAHPVNALLAGAAGVLNAEVSAWWTWHSCRKSNPVVLGDDLNVLGDLERDP